MLIVAIGSVAISVNIARNVDVSSHGQCREQIEFLKNEPDLVPANSGEFAVIHSGDFVAINEDLAGTRSGHRTENVHQRGFAATSRSHYRDKLALADPQVHASKGFHIDLTDRVSLPQIECFQQGVHFIKSKN